MNGEERLLEEPFNLNAGNWHFRCNSVRPVSTPLRLFCQQQHKVIDKKLLGLLEREKGVHMVMLIQCK